MYEVISAGKHNLYISDAHFFLPLILLKHQLFLIQLFLSGHPTEVEGVDLLILASQWAGVANIRQVRTVHVVFIYPMPIYKDISSR